METSGTQMDLKNGTYAQALGTLSYNYFPRQVHYFIQAENIGIFAAAQLALQEGILRNVHIHTDSRAVRSE